MKATRNSYLFWLACACFTVLLGSCQHSPEPANKGGEEPLPADWSTENQVVFHLKAEPNGLHPTHGLTDDLRYFIFNYTQMRLVNDDIINRTIRPALIEGMPKVSEDQLTFTYTLRAEPKWDDGASLTVEDVFFTLKLHKCSLTNNPAAKPYLDNLKSILLVEGEERSFQLVMKKPYFQNISFLVDFPILQKNYHDPKNVLGAFSLEQLDGKDFNAEAHPELVDWVNEQNDGKYGRNPELMNGLGAYKVGSWETDRSLVLERKKDHWTSKLASPDPYDVAYPERMTFRFIRDPNAILLEFKQQNFDGSTSLPVDQLLQLQADEQFNKNYESAFVELFNYTFMGMNQKPEEHNRNPVFTDKLTRKAVALLTPVDDVIKVAYQGQANPIVGVVSPLKPDYNPSLKRITRNLSKARQLLREAGWEDLDQDGILDREVDGKRIRFSFSICYPAVSDRWKDMATIIAEGLAEAGIEGKPEGLEVSVFVEGLGNHDFDAALLSWSSQARPDDFTQVWHTDSWRDHGSNFFGFGSDYSDSLIVAYRQTVDDEVRKPISHAFQQYVYDDQPYVFLLASRRRTAIHRRFDNRGMYAEKPGVMLNFLKLKGGNANRLELNP